MAELALIGTKGGPSLREVGPSFMPTSSYLALGDLSIVIDCGLGVTAGLVRAGYSLTRLSHIFITHYHSDHYLELGALVHTAWTAGLAHKIHIYGPPGLDKIWDGFQSMMAFDIAVRISDEGRQPLDELVELHIYDTSDDQPFLLLDDGVMTVTGLVNKHPPIDKSFALRFTHQGKTICFSGDTAYLPTLPAFAGNCDILVHEAMLAEGLDYILEKTKSVDDRLRTHLLQSHSFAGDAAHLAQMAGVSHLVLNHLIPPERHICSDADWQAAVSAHFDGKLSVGFDGLKLTF